MVDHAWTFRPEQARTHLRSIPGLLQRMCNLIGMDFDESDQEASIKDVVNGIWKYSQSYSIGIILIIESVQSISLVQFFSESKRRSGRSGTDLVRHG